MPTVPEMTPELLAQLERTALHFTAAGCFDDDIQVAEALASIPALVAAAKERDQLQTAALDAMFERDQLSEMLGASQIDRVNLGDQVDQLRAEVERLTSESDLWMRDRDEATAERDAARQLADKREEERDALHAEVERLLGLGLEAVKVLDRCGIVTNFRALIGDSPVRDFDPFAPADQLPADVLADVETERGMRPIERKP